MTMYSCVSSFSTKIGHPSSALTWITFTSHLLSDLSPFLKFFERGKLLARVCKAAAVAVGGAVYVLLTDRVDTDRDHVQTLNARVKDVVHVTPSATAFLHATDVEHT